MKRFFVALLVVVSTFGTLANAQTGRITNEKQILDSLTTIDPEIIKYFPRWKVCEPDLQVQIYQTFLFMGFSKAELSEQNIEVLASPRDIDTDPFEVLMITCGSATMNSVQIEYYMGDKLVRFLTGEYIYQGPERGYPRPDGSGLRDYCYNDIPQEMPLQASQAQLILDYIKQPTNVKQAFSLSLFEQSLKIGQTGFWLRSQIGSDHMGYHFWSAGEAKITLQRPLYVNKDVETRSGIPYLINAYLGGSYRLTGGRGTSDMFGWVKERVLNGGPGGKMVFGFDFHMPFEPAFGISFNAELPFQELNTTGIDETTYGFYTPNLDNISFVEGDGREGIEIQKVAPVNRGSGYVTAFYHWWLDKMNPENYFRFDLGLGYSEVREMAYYEYDGMNNDIIHELSVFNVLGLRTYKPKEFGDWVHAKVEYRNQAVFPFGMSVQYANQIMLGKVWLPLFSNWLYIEAKYATPLRGLRPYESRNFFMISPLLRLTI